MMNRFSVVLQNAFDALAPPAALHEDFVYHWKRLMKHYLDVATTNKVAIEMTNIPAHIEQLEKILLKEDSESDGSTGPCLEYLLKHELLDLLATLAVTDDPPGMRHYVLKFVTQILTRLKTPVLAHNSVFPSLQRLVEMCNGHYPTPSEGDEVKFLFALTAQLRKHPQLVRVYITEPKTECKPIDPGPSAPTVPSPPSDATLVSPPNNPLFRPLTSPETQLLVVAEPTSSSSTPASNPDAPCDLTVSNDTTQPQPRFPLVDSLVTYILSADSNVRVKACQGIMLLASLPDDKCTEVVATHSTLCRSLALKLTAQYLEIPPTTDPNHVDDMHSTWGLDTPLPLEVEESCEGARQVATFLGWLDFCDQVAVEARPPVAVALGRAVRELFLEQELDPQLLPNSLVLALLTKCFKVITSPQLTKVLSEWLVGEGRAPESPGVVTCGSLQALLELCASPDPALSLEALRLFEVVLERNIEHCVHCLVLCYVEGRGYADGCRSPSHIDSWSDEEDQRERNTPDPESNISMIRTMPPTQIDKIIQSWLSVVPGSLRSCEAGSGYHQYVSESQRQYSLVAAKCRGLAWPRDPGPITQDNLSSDSRPEADATGRPFYEGPFLRMIFNRIRALPDQAYEVNLQLTAVISRLALLPHPLLHEYLLDTGLILRPDADSLNAALNETATRLAAVVPDLPDYRRRLQDIRHRLLGHAPTDHKGYMCSSEDQAGLLESVVVLEEVCKELAAIAFVKCHPAS